MKTLKVSLLGTAVGIAAWVFGLGHVIWPAHPQIAGFLVTLGATILVQVGWPYFSEASPH